MTRARDMANLGSQAGSGLDASDITTGVLPVGVTGGSGLTALGTVTAGNISHADIVYPTGMVIKEQAFDEVATIAGNSTTFASGNTMSFTKLKASGDSYIVFTWNGYVDKCTNSGSYIDWRMGYTPSGGSIAYTDIRTHDNDNNSPADLRIYYPMCVQYYISTLNAGTHTFVMQARWGGGYNNNSQIVTDAEQYVFIKEVTK